MRGSDVNTCVISDVFSRYYFASDLFYFAFAVRVLVWLSTAACDVYELAKHGFREWDLAHRVRIA